MAITDGIFEELMPATASRLKQQQATIDALVAALVEARDHVEADNQLAPIFDKIDAALALARGK